MNEPVFFNGLLIAFFCLALVVFIILFFIPAPYGRHVRRGWGLTIGNKVGWLVMESPSPIIFITLFFLRDNPLNTVLVIFLIMWCTHYLHRAFIYPFSLRKTANRMPWLIVSFGFVFNLMNAYLNGRYVFSFSGGYGNEWLADPRFIIGVLMFIIGFFINRRADQVLRSLRQHGETGYKIPYSRLHNLVSSPNYLGEIIIWSGWATATWSLPGLAFALWTVANLLPRARDHHRWYHENFPDYPPERKALVPGIW